MYQVSTYPLIEMSICTYMYINLYEMYIEMSICTYVYVTLIGRDVSIYS